MNLEEGLKAFDLTQSEFWSTVEKRTMEIAFDISNIKDARTAVNDSIEEILIELSEEFLGRMFEPLEPDVGVIMVFGSHKMFEECDEHVAIIQKIFKDDT